MQVLSVIALLVAGLMVGAELCVAAFVHPELEKLPDAAHLPAASALARLMGNVMPIWYAAVLLLTLAEGFLAWRQTGRVPVWLAVAAGLWVMAILFSVTALVPINNRIKSWEHAAPPADWKQDRNRWDMLHRWRVVLLTVALACLIMGVLERSA